MNSVSEDQVDKDAYTVPIEDLEFNHLSNEQQVHLLQVLKKHQVWSMSNPLGKTRLEEHSIDMQEAQSVIQHPYPVPETKRQQLQKSYRKCFLQTLYSHYSGLGGVQFYCLRSQTVNSDSVWITGGWIKIQKKLNILSLVLKKYFTL